MKEEILAALRKGAQKSASFWKPVYHAETDDAWRQIGLDIALDDTVSLAANELGCTVWEEGRSILIDDERVDVMSDAYFLLKDAWKVASKFKVGDKFRRHDGLSCAVVVRANSRYDVAVMVGDSSCVVEGDDEHVSTVLARYHRI